MNRLKKAFILTSTCTCICLWLFACNPKEQMSVNGGQASPASENPQIKETSKNNASTPPLEPGSCACQQEQTSSLAFNHRDSARMFPGLMTPGIPLYYQVTHQDNQSFVTMVSTNNDLVTLDDQDTLRMGADITIAQTQKCSVGIYQATFSENTRQSGTFCDTQQCYTADEVTMHLFDFSAIPAVQSTPTQSYQCMPSHLKDQAFEQWSIFLLMEDPTAPRTFYYISDQQGTMRLTGDQKTSFELDLAPILSSFDSKWADFPKMNGKATQALYQSTPEDLEIQFKANFISAKGHQPTHLIGTILIQDQSLLVIGRPLPQLVSIQ